MNKPLFELLNKNVGDIVREYRLSSAYHSQTDKRYGILIKENLNGYGVNIVENLKDAKPNYKLIAGEEFTSKEDAIAFAEKWMNDKEQQMKMKLLLNEKE